MTRALAARICLSGAPAVALVSCVHQPQSDIPLQIAATCQSPISWVGVGRDGQLIIKPPRDADYKKVNCILGELRPDLMGITFVGNEAFPADHPAEKARRACKATRVIYDARGPVLTVKFAGLANNPGELSRQVTCMRDRLVGTGIKVEAPAAS